MKHGNMWLLRRSFFAGVSTKEYRIKLSFHNFGTHALGLKLKTRDSLLAPALYLHKPVLYLELSEANLKRSWGKMPLTKGQIEVFKETFRLFDKNGDGEISAEEFRTLLQAGGENPTDADLQEFINHFDTDGTGNLNLDEFLAMMAMGNPNFDEESIRGGFSVIDKDGDGFITPADLQQFISGVGYNLTDQEVNEVIREADIDGDGEINYEEFKRCVETLLAMNDNLPA